MAVKNPARAVTTGIAGSSKEAAGRYNEHVQSMRTAARLLRPNEVAGEYDAGRLLSTTLGGYQHAITPEDLQTFKRNAETLGKHFRGGITAKAVVDRSLQADRERANREITYAVPHRFAGGTLHVVTNASKHSDVTRHHVLLELLNFNAAVSSPADGKELAKALATGPLRVACDCGRWKYWYSYIGTIGKFNASAPQLGFPKIRNPELRGVACKHVLRVMQQLGTPGIRDFIAKMIDNSREKLDNKPKILSKKEAEEIAKKQAAQSGWKRSQIETTGERRVRLAQARVAAAMAARAKARPVAPTARKVASAKKAFDLNVRKLASLGVLTPAQMQAMLSKLGR